MLAIDEKQLAADLREIFHNRGPGGAQFVDFMMEFGADNDRFREALQRLMILSQEH